MPPRNWHAKALIDCDMNGVKKRSTWQHGANTAQMRKQIYGKSGDDLSLC